MDKVSAVILRCIIITSDIILRLSNLDPDIESRVEWIGVSLVFAISKKTKQNKKQNDVVNLHTFAAW